MTDKSEKPEESEKEKEKEEESEGFLGKVKGFVQDIGEKIEETLGFGTPTADVEAIHIPSINLKQAEIVVDVRIKNPNPIPIPLVDIDYLIENEGRKLVSGLIPDSGTVQAHGEETMKIPATLIFEDIKNAYGDLAEGSVLPYRVKLGLIFDIPVFGRCTLPLEKTGEIPVPYTPGTEIEKIHLESFSFEETVAVLHVKVENKNEFEVGVSALELELWLGEVSIGGAEIKKDSNSSKIEKKGVSKIEIPITFRPKDFGSALWDVISGKGTQYSMKGSLDVDTPFGKMNFPIHKEGGQTRLKKNDDDDDDDDNE